MGDSYDEDEGRLMIDDAILDSAHSSQAGCAETSAKTITYEKTVELTPSSEDGVESHPVDPEPKPNFYCESAIPKAVQGVHRDDRLKMTIKRTQSPVNSGGQYSFHGEKRGDGSMRNEDVSKEEGEIDDEEETGNSLHAQSTAVNVHQPASWPGYQNTSFEAGSAGTSKFRHGQQFEHHAVYSTPHSSTRQLAVNISVSSNVTSPGPANVTNSVTVEEHNSHVLSSSYTPQIQTSTNETEFDEDSRDLDQQNAVGVGLKNAGTHSSPCSNVRKKKRRVSERDEHETCQASPSSTSPSFNVGAIQLGINSAGASSAKKKRPPQNIRDRSTCVSVKSIQTNDGDIDLRVGSTHCLNISVLAKASNYLYYVTNWNGHDLYGVLGDGLPPLQHTYMSKKSNRSSSVCPPNGFSEIKTVGRKPLIGNVGRPSSASTSDVQSVGGDLQDEERSQSPVSWFTSGSNDPISALGSFGIPTDNGSSQLRECVLSAMYSCPVAGCEHRYDTQSQLAVHYHTHFVKEDGGRAIYVETMGTQTNVVVTKDVAVETDGEITPIRTISSEEIASEVRKSRGDENSTHLVSPKPKLSKTLTNHEEQSISELFRVVTQKTETSSGTAKTEGKKTFGVKSPKNTNISKVYGTLLSSNAANQNEMPTALDAIRKMVTNNSGETHSREQQSNSVISNSGMLPSTSVASTTLHGGAASPAFSDISDDAPTLEKEVADKSEERSLDRIKELVNSTEKAPLEQLSLSIEDEKMIAVSKSGIGSSNLLCPVSSSTTTIATTLSVPRVSAEMNQGSKKNETKTQPQTNTIGPFTPSFMDPSGLRHASVIPISIPNLSNVPSASVFAQPYFIPFINPSVSNATTPGMSQPHTSKHKIHDLKANPPNLIPFQSKEGNSIGQSSSVVSSTGSQSLSQGGIGNNITAKQAVHQQLGSQSAASTNSFASIQPHASNNSDRSASAQNAQSSALNFMQHQQQQQQAYFAQLQQHQQMQYMQRFGAAFPITGPPNSVNAVAQQAYEQQMAALHASFGYPGIFMPPTFPPK
ncbi:unnamed protein product [Litomosoides sigmodontis]|uniref:C2H2-type domain-containing protein n=1 Tax=Litomosoides sigmodontis TaxID=42156 RepID=A0A3P6T3A2_LITSI|nr:unnamed protein product [Litomosoides sigmodontis]